MIQTVEPEQAGERLDVFCASFADVTRSRALSLIKAGQVRIDGVVAEKAGIPLKAGSVVALAIPEPEVCEALPQDIPLRVVYEDADLAVVYKPSGLVVHPAAGNPDGTLVNALLYHLTGLSGVGGVLRPGIVHRIDKDTSGLLLVAKNDQSHVMLAEQIKAHTVLRAYRAIVIGHMAQARGHVDAPIGRHPTDRKKMAIVPNGRNAVTDFEVLRALRGATYLEARLKTGRTHQIRVHMASLGHPVLGDPVYGPKKSPYPVEGGQLLHAYLLGFVHPRTGEFLRFEAEPEPRFLYWLDKLALS